MSSLVGGCDVRTQLEKWRKGEYFEGWRFLSTTLVTTTTTIQASMLDSKAAATVLGGGGLQSGQREATRPQLR